MCDIPTDLTTGDDVRLVSDIMEGFEGELAPLDLDMSLDDGDDQTQESSMAATSNTSNSSPQKSLGKEEGQEDHSMLPEKGDSPESQNDDTVVQKNGPSAVTDFTRRRNWSQRILEEMKDMLLVLSPDGRILYASPATRSVANLEPDRLNGNFLSQYIHDDDKTMFIREFHESIATGHRLRFHFRFRKADGVFVILEASGHPHFARETATLGTGKEGNPCSGFFLICRPYPTQSCQLLDSFLEHKVENMRLTRRIADLKKEEEEEIRAQQQWIRRPDSSDNMSPEHANQNLEPSLGSASGVNPNGDKGLMLPPAKPRASVGSQDSFLIGISEGNAELAISREPSYLDEIEMMTGLRYSEGERSLGLSTGEANGGLIQDDIDLRGDTPSESDKKKKLKTSEEYVCTDCGTLASPEWRKGPSGPKTLCNACGLRWAKKEKKRQGSLQSSSLAKEV